MHKWIAQIRVKIYTMKDFDMKVLAERIKELRLRKSMTTLALGVSIGTDSGSISRWETAKSMPSIYFLFRLAKKYGVSVDYLIGVED